MKAIESQSDYIREMNKSFNNSLAEKYDWYHDWMASLNCANDCIAYIIESEEFSEYLNTFQYNKVSVYGTRIEEFQSKLKANIEKLKEILATK